MRKSPGFTIAELLVVVLIVLVLAALAMPAYQNYSARSQIHAAPGPLAAADEAIARLSWEHLALSAPRSMELGSIATVELALGGGMTTPQLAALLQEQGAREHLLVLVSERMEATLTGLDFEIEPVTPTEQVVSTQDATVWKWEVKGKTPGRSRLKLSLNALLSVDGKDTRKSVETLDHDIQVTVTSRQGLWALMQTYWTYLAFLASAILIPLIGVWYKRSAAARTPGGPAP